MWYIDTWAFWHWACNCSVLISLGASKPLWRLETSSSLSTNERTTSMWSPRLRGRVAAYCPRSTGIAHFRNAYCIVFPLDNVQMMMSTYLARSKENQFCIPWWLNCRMIGQCLGLKCFTNAIKKLAKWCIVFRAFTVYTTSIVHE